MLAGGLRPLCRSGGNDWRVAGVCRALRVLALHGTRVDRMRTLSRNVRGEGYVVVHSPEYMCVRGVRILGVMYVLCPFADRLGSMPPAASLADLPLAGAGPHTSQAVRLISASTTLATGTSPAPAVPQVTNLLPWIQPEPTADPHGGVYVGEGLPPVPVKLAERIRRWDYVDMAELLPEFWPVAKPDDTDGRKAGQKKPRQITDFSTWLHCFATFTGILGGQFPEAIPELMAYLITISRVSQDFAGLAWVRYDSAFRRQAAITGNRKRSQVNPSLYSLCFTGRAQEVQRCELCLSTAHRVQQCPLRIEGDPELPSRVKAVESVVLSLSRACLPAPTWKPSSEVCRSWNANRCRHPRCRYRHVCSSCGEAHPVVTCPRGQRELPTTEMRGPSGPRLARREAHNPY